MVFAAARVMPDYFTMKPKSLEKAAAKTNDPEELISIAGGFLGHGDAERAVALCERANEIQPSARAFWMLGQLARGERDADAVAAFRAAVELDPHDVDSWSSLAATYQAMSLWSECAAAAESAIALAPMRTAARETAAIAAKELGSPKTARRHWAVIVAAGDDQLSTELSEMLGDAPIDQARALITVSNEFIRLDPGKKLSLQERALALAEQNAGSDDAKLALAYALINHPRRGEEAGPIVMELVAKDNAEAHCLLGWLLMRGQGVAKDDVASRRHHEIAAERGVADSQFELSIYDEMGIGGPIDLGAARRWEQLAADQGHVRACLNVASWAATGKHGPIDHARAVRYYERAAIGGYADAAQRLAVMYGTGSGVEEDFSAAVRWREIANALGAENAPSPFERGPSSTDRLHAAICDGDVDEVRAAIADGADVEALDVMERTPLMAAADEGQLEVVRALLEAGADPNNYRVRVMFAAVLDTALIRARESKHRAIVKVLKEAGALEAKDLPDPHTLAVETSASPHERLVDALWGDDDERVRRALADGADANGAAHGDERVLAAAVRLRKPSYVRMLLEAGAKPDARADDGKPALLQMVFDEASVECFEALLAAGADANVRVDREDAATYLPEDSKLRLRMLRALLAHGFEVDRRDDDGYTLLARAVEQCDAAAFELLLECGADPTVRVGKRKNEMQTLAELAEYASGKGIKKIRARLVELATAKTVSMARQTGH